MQTRDGQQLTIREAEPDDAKTLRHFVLEVTSQTSFLGFGPDEYEKTEKEVRALIVGAKELPNKVYLIALVDNTIVGTLNFLGGRRKRSLHVGEFGMSVHQNYWAQGIGSALLVALRVWANDSGVVKKINLHVRTDNARAIRLYERMGYVREGTTSRAFLVDGEFYDCHIMGLEL